jgi:CheY-like chemotaxis protein
LIAFDHTAIVGAVIEPDNFALVPKPPGALEKAKPGAKRILAGMVADTLALVKKEPLRETRPLRIVMVNDESCVLQSFEILLRGWFKDVTLLLYANGVEAWQELSQTEPDLLITDDAMPVMRGSELCQRLLDRKVTYPIIVNSPWEPTEQWVREFASRGLNVFFLPMPFDTESLRRLLESSFTIPREKIQKPVEIARKIHRTRPPTIVILDDEEGTSVVFQ